jgi:hypothetical protein
MVSKFDHVTLVGVALRNQPMVFHDRKLVFLRGPENVVVELAEWLRIERFT